MKEKQEEDFIYSQENYEDNDHGNRPNLVIQKLPLFITVFAMISELNTFITNTTEIKYQEKVRFGLPPNSDYEIQNRSDRDKWLQAKLDELKNHIGEDIKKQNRKETYRKLEINDAFNETEDIIYNQNRRYKQKV